MNETSCYLCSLDAEKCWRDFRRDIYFVRRRRCGEYGITRKCSYNPRNADPRTLVVIADFTGHRNGVYYEAGFARALGREVVNCCRESDFDGLHFDTNHLNHVKWATAADLRQKLADRIRATITTR